MNPKKIYKIFDYAMSIITVGIGVFIVLILWTLLKLKMNFIKKAYAWFIWRYIDNNGNDTFEDYLKNESDMK